MSMIALAAALLSGQSAPPARSAEDLTRDLNSAPPSVAAPVAPRPSPPATQSEPRPARPQPAQPSPAPSSPAGAAPSRPSAGPATQAAPTGSTSSVTRGLNSAPPSATPAPRASPPAPAASTVRSASPPAPRPAPASAPAPVPTTASAAPIPAAAPAEAAAEALPFRIDLPEGFEIEPADAGPQAKVYTVRKDGRSFVMIYQGPASQFPIYDGQLIDAGGRASVVIEEDGRRRAVEHLFAKDLESRETHVWLSYLEGPDSAQAEQIAQSVDPR